VSDAPAETYDAQLDHPQADSDGCKKIPMPDGGDCYLEQFADFDAVYTRPRACSWWVAMFFDKHTRKAVYRFGDETDQFTGKEYTQLIEIRQAAQQWVADVRRLRGSLRLGSRLKL